MKCDSVTSAHELIGHLDFDLAPKCDFGSCDNRATVLFVGIRPCPHPKDDPLCAVHRRKVEEMLAYSEFYCRTCKMANIDNQFCPLPGGAHG